MRRQDGGPAAEVEEFSTLADLREIPVEAVGLSVFEPLIDRERQARLEKAAEDVRTLLGERSLWNVNSTPTGGGVAEMLRALVGHTRGAGIDARWVVIEGDPEFFGITKRIHNRVHGVRGDEGDLGSRESAHYVKVTTSNALSLRNRLRPGDIVLLHDPQTAGMGRTLCNAGAKVLWRSHIGSDTPNSWSEEAWAFLRPYLDGFDGFIFSRRAYVPPWLPQEDVSIIAPSIDPFSVKNADIPGPELPRFLNRIGLLWVASAPAAFTRSDGTRDKLRHRATIVSEGGPLDPTDRLVVQVSRWDRLKDMQGVMEGFASVSADVPDAELLLVGPYVLGVSDDPEGAAVLEECTTRWEELPPAVRRHIRLVSLPMRDVDENAAMVNALQRSAEVVVQKSLVEGFGLTVAEAMWKGKPVVASRVGGIVDQVAPGTGILLDDPTDLEAFGQVLANLLDRPDQIREFGINARKYVLANFVGDLHLLKYAKLIEDLLR